jgi:hypothetical protein
MKYSSRIKRVTIRMTYKEHEKLLKEAERLNLNVSDYVRIFVPPLFMFNKKG